MNNQTNWSDRDISIQIGACLNKAVDIAIAHQQIIGKLDETLFITVIESYVDKLFEIGTQKKQAVLDAQLKSEEQDKLGTPYDENYPQVEVASEPVLEPQK